MNKLYTIGEIGYSQGHGEQFPRLHLNECCVFFKTKKDAQTYITLNKCGGIPIELSFGNIINPTENHNGESYEWYDKIQGIKKKTKKELKKDLIQKARYEDQCKRGLNFYEMLQEDIDCDMIKMMMSYLKLDRKCKKKIK